MDTNKKQKKEILTFEKPTPNTDSEPPSLEEIDQIIKDLKNNKTPGEDSLIAEMWKIGSDSLVQKTHKILQDIWKDFMRK